jgi:hypothetical protein
VLIACLPDRDSAVERDLEPGRVNGIDRACRRDETRNGTGSVTSMRAASARKAVRAWKTTVRGRAMVVLGVTEPSVAFQAVRSTGPGSPTRRVGRLTNRAAGVSVADAPTVLTPGGQQFVGRRGESVVIRDWI